MVENSLGKYWIEHTNNKELQKTAFVSQIGIANELYHRGIDIPILGVMCGMDATKNIIKNILSIIIS